MADVISEIMTDMELLADEVIECYFIGSDTERCSSLCSITTYYDKMAIKKANVGTKAIC